MARPKSREVENDVSDSNSDRRRVPRLAAAAFGVCSRDESERLNRSSDASDAAPRTRPGDLLRAALLGTPLLAPALVPVERLPAGVAYVLTQGRWLIVLGMLAALVSVGLIGRVRWPRLGPGGARGWAAAATGLGTLLLLWAVPPGLWSARQWSGDEPKYLRMTDSLYHDLDLDLSSGHTEPLTLRLFARNLRALGEELCDALGALVRDPRPALEGHAWRAGNWTVTGRGGGRYHVQGAGLPLLLLPSRWLQPWLDPERPDSLALLTLVGLWSLALMQTVRLAQEVSGSPACGAGAGLAVACTAPLLLCGYHFYPEVAAAAAVPWLARAVRPAAAGPGRARTVALAFVCGALPWLHVKFVPLGALAAALLLVKLGRGRARIALAVAAAALPVAALLLFNHRVTGLLRPDALYVRYAPEFYSGGPSLGAEGLVLGLITALFGARDGVFVLAPLLVVAAIGLPWSWRRERGTVVALVALCASLWLAAALHGGGAPGPPGRLLAPVITLSAAPLAVALVELRGDGRFLWTAASALVLGAGVTLTLAGSWQRAVDPYAGMFLTPAADFSLDLPDAPRPGPRSPLREVARGALLLAAVAAWVIDFARRRTPPRSAWSAARDFHLAAWASLVLVATLAGWLRG